MNDRTSAAPRCMFLLALGLYFSISGCEDAGTGPIFVGSNDLCYEQWGLVNWDIATNSIEGGNRKIISNYAGADEYPRWSPDGRYIVYSRRLPTSQIRLVICDTKARTERYLTPDSILAGLAPIWTPDGRILYSGRTSYGGLESIYTVNPDGSQTKRILDRLATVYFYADGYRFIYEWDNKLFRSDVDNTVNELLLELPPIGATQFITIRDFNPHTGDFLVNTNMIEGLPSAIATLNVESKQLSAVLGAEDGFEVYLPKYSKDYTKIAFVEHGDSVEFLSILEGGTKRRLVGIPRGEPLVYLGWPMEFSPHGKYLAFSEDTFGSAGGWLYRYTSLFLVDLSSLDLRQLETNGHGPSWNPRSFH
jgi:Tol biopolymer transport system component